MYVCRLAGRRQRRGVVAALVALCTAFVLLPVLAIAVDGAMSWDDRRKAQAAADAAALAAAIQLYQDNPTFRFNPTPPANQPASTSGARTAALTLLDTHTFTDAACEGQRTVTIPARSNNARIDQAPGSVEVELTFNQRRGFSRIWGSDPLPIHARAVARVRFFSQNNGVLLLDPNDQRSLNIHGDGDSQLRVTRASVIVNSNNQDAAYTNGNSRAVAASFEVTGANPGYDGNFRESVADGAIEPNTGVPPTPDPLRSLPEPTVTSPTFQNQNQIPSVGNVHTMSPGRYRFTPRFTNNEQVVLLPGTYFLEKGFVLSGQASATGTGVTLFNDGSGPAETITLSGSGQLNISAPTTGTYQGILLFQSRDSRDDTTVTITGNAGTNLQGTVYAPNSPVTVNGNGNATVGSQFISRTLEITGNGRMFVDFAAGPATPPPVFDLVEGTVQPDLSAPATP